MAYQYIPGSGVSVSATASSVAGTLPAAGKSASALYVYNSGTIPVAIRYGVGAQTAVLSDFIVPPGVGVFLAKAQGSDGVAAIGTGAGPSVVYFSAVDGTTY